MKFERDSNNKIILRKADGTLARFDYTVDAKEALFFRKGPNGEQLYFLPDKVEKYKDEPVEESAEEKPIIKADEIDEKIEQIKAGKRGRPKKEEVEQEDEE